MLLSSPPSLSPLIVLFRLEYTQTQKLVKGGLRKEGVDPAVVNGDPVLWLQGGKYVPFSKDDWTRLQDGKVKL